VSASAAVELSEVAAFVRGITFKPDNVVPVGTPGAAACMRTKNVQAELDLNDVWGIPESFVKRDDQYLIPGDMLVSSANSWNLVGKCCWVPSLPWRSTFGGFVSVLRPNPARVDPRYLFRWFASDRTQATVRSFGQQTTNISNLNLDRCLKLKLRLPPLPEQRRIAEILDKADALRAKRRTALAQLDVLTESIFLHMFGDPMMNDREWDSYALKDVATKITDGTHKTPVYMETGIEFLSAKDLKGGRIVWNTGKYIAETEHTQLTKRCNPALGDVLLAKSGSLGAVAIIDREHPFSLFESLCLIKHDRERIRGEYLTSLLRTPSMLANLLGRNKGVAVKHLHLVDVRNLRIPVPPISAQREFAARVAQVERLRVAQCASLDALERLFAALQGNSFRGEFTL
jgi:type I restriction enzyme S subunit